MILGIGGGLLAALRRRRLTDRGIVGASMVALSTQGKRTLTIVRVPLRPARPRESLGRPTVLGRVSDHVTQRACSR